MEEIRMKDVEFIDFETIGMDYSDQIYSIQTNDGKVFYATALINKNMNFVIQCKEKICQEIKDCISSEALSVWRNEVNVQGV